MIKGMSLKNLIAAGIACVMVTTWLPVQALAATYVSKHLSSSTVYSNNIHDHNYSSVSSVADSYMCTGNDGTVTRVENFGDVILVEKYNSKYQITMQHFQPFYNHLKD